MDGLHGEMAAGLPLLATKLHAPGWRAGFVSRPRLVAALDRTAASKLTLVSAPPGFGKTTLLAEWLAAGSRHAAWVSLDAGDNDPARFWAYVVAALAKAAPAAGERASALLRSPQPPPIETILTLLINDLDAFEDEIALVLDDLHLIDAPSIHGALGFLLDHLPPRVRLVVATRADPPLPLARLRARGELIEARAADLRFTPDEAAVFFNEMMGLELGSADVAALETRTEGWIAGLQLAALSLRDHVDVAGFVRTFSGDHRHVVDYLIEEVLARQPDDVRQFLLQTAILDRLSGPLCDAVTGGSDGDARLAALERGNFFVVPLDDARRWHRYHHLFADVLRARLLAERPEQVATLRQRAATWLEAHGIVVEAIEQARAAENHETVARLLVANIDAFERAGRHASIARWAASLPEEMVRARPRLALIHAAVAMGIESNLASARRLTAWAAEAIAAFEAGGFDPLDDIDGTVVGADGLDALKGEVLAQNLMHSARHLPVDEVGAMVEAALQLVPPEKQRVRAMLHRVRAETQVKRNDLESALAIFDQSVDEARRTRNGSLLAGILQHRGQVSLAMGRLDDGHRDFEEAIAVDQHGSDEGHWTISGARAWLAEILLEQGDLAGAVGQIAVALAQSGDLPLRSPVLFLRAAAAKVLLASGDGAGAAEQLAQAQHFAVGVPTFRFAPFLSATRIDVQCRRGDLDAAAAVARERGLAPDMAVDDDNEEEMIAYARYLIASGDPAGAGRVLKNVLPTARIAGRTRHEIHALTLQALALEQMGRRPLALESLGRATMLGEPGRFNRTFTGEGPLASELLAALAAVVRSGRGPAETGSSNYLNVLSGVESPALEPTAARPTMAGLAELLTAREIEILRLIAAGLRNQEIADRLFISLPTVKRHLANAYGKLGAGHRTDAIAKANALHLL